jgi:serine/threonine protein kinase
MIGETISHYKILEKLGEGGMGVVYKAEDTKLDRLVALKFLPSHLSASEQDKARFIQEAKAASALNHPNVCTIHAIEEHGGQLFIVMEYVDGQTLRQKKDAINFKQAIDIGIQIADGLAAAHEKGIVHRDIKPENIMIRKDGIAQIMDFGLAKLRGNISRLTKEGSTVGTAGYMSPEQVQGLDTDHRSDIFSLGVLLYELFTGQLPFKGVHETALMYEIVNVDAPPMSSTKGEIDPELDRIILECLEKDINERTQSVKQVSVDLKRFKRESGRQRISRVSPGRDLQGASKIHLRQESTERERMPARSSNYIPWIVASILTVFASTVSVLYFLGPRPDSELTIRFPLSIPDNLTINQVAISPDGKNIAFTGTSQGKTLLWVRPLNAMQAHSVNGTESATFPFWSPDGRFIGFFGGGKLQKVDLNGSAPIGVCEAGNGRGGTWNQAGEIVFAPSSGGVLFRVSAEGGIPKALTTLDTAKNEFEHVWPTFLPGGKKFLYLARRVRDQENTVYISSLDQNERKQVVNSVANAIYSPPGYVLFLKDRSLMAQRFDADAGNVIGDPFLVANGVGHIPILGIAAFSLSQNGVLAMGGGRSANRQFVWFDRSGKQLGVVGTPGNYFDIVLSPDGKRAATQLWDLQTGNSDIWILELEHSLSSRFTFDAAVEDDPVWSPDGKWLAFSSSRDGSPNIYKKQASGTGTEESLHKSNLGEYPSDWSRDGQFILFQKLDPKTKEDMWILPVSGDRKPYPLVKTAFSEWMGQFSPDGKWLAYTSNESGRFEVYVRSFPEPGRKWQISTNGGAQPRWRSDGTELLYIAPDRRLMVVDVKRGEDFGYGIARPLFETGVDNFDAPNRYVVTKDGQKFLINIPVRETASSPVAITVNWTTEYEQKK